jgi:hypothetical protein
MVTNVVNRKKHVLEVRKSLVRSLVCKEKRVLQIK